MIDDEVDAVVGGRVMPRTLGTFELGVAGCFRIERDQTLGAREHIEESFHRHTAILAARYVGVRSVGAYASKKYP